MPGIFGKDLRGALSFPAFTADQKRAWGPQQLFEAGTVDKLTMHCQGGTSAQVMKAVIYADSSGSPGALLGTGTEVTIGASQAEGDVDFPFSPGVHLAAGLYWLGIHSGATTGAYFWYDLAGGNPQKYNTDTYVGGATDPFGAGTNDSGDATIYATYTPDVVDATPPAIVWTSPVNGADVSGTITLNVTATDNVAVRKVQFQVEGVTLSEDRTAPFTATLNTAAFENGQQVVLTALGTDPQGQTGSGSITVTVRRSSYIIETSGDHTGEYRLNKTKFGSFVGAVDAGRNYLNVKDFGAKNDGEVNPATGVVTGTDNTVAFQAAADEAYNTGCRQVIVPHAGLSKYKHVDGTPLDKGYRILGQVTLKRNVSFVGEGEGKTGGNQGPGVSGGHGTATALEIPPSANPTLLIENSSTSAFVLVNANTFKNFNFLWPGQIKPPNVTPTVFPAGIELQGHDMKVENLTDYNSYIFIKRTGGSVHTHIKGIASASWKTIIQDTTAFAEWEISDIDYNGGTIYNTGRNVEPLGPLFDLGATGPCFLHHVGINCEWLNKSEAIKVTTAAFGLMMDNIWIDTTAGHTVISVGQASFGSGGFAAINQYNNIHITRGCTADYALEISYPDGNLGGGANQNTHQFSNSHFYQPVKLTGGAQYLFSNCILQAGFDLNGSATGSALGQRVQISNSTAGGGSFFRARGGKNFVQMSNIGANQLSQAIYCERAAQTLPTATVTIASPGVVSFTGLYGFDVGDPMVLTTTGALPTGLTAGTTYYVSERTTANSFKLATSVVNAFNGVHINTSGSQSGTHTLKTVPGTLWVAYLDMLKDLRFDIPAGTVLATGETVIGSAFLSSPPNLNGSAGTKDYMFTVMSAEGWGANGDQWKIRHSDVGLENAILCTTNVQVFSTTYASLSRSSGSEFPLPWFSTMTDPIFSHANDSPNEGFEPFEIRYINNTGAPLTVPAQGFGLLLTYCCM
jgi:hypothetical protein